MSERIRAGDSGPEPRLLRAGVGSIRHWVAPGTLSDPNVVLYVARAFHLGAAGSSGWPVSSCWPTGPASGAPGHRIPGHTRAAGALNGLVRHLLLTNRPVTWLWMLFLSAADIALSGRPWVQPRSAAAVATQTVRGLPLQHDLPVRVHLTVRVAGSGKDAC